MADAGSPLPVAPLPDVHPALGRKVSEHLGRPLAGGVLLYVGGIFVVTSFYQLANALSELGAGTFPTSSLISFAGTLVVGAALLARCVYLWRQSLGIYERGFAVHRVTGDRVVSWTDIAEVTALRERSSLGSTFSIELALRDGRTVVLTDALAGLEAQTALFQNRGGMRG